MWGGIFSITDCTLIATRKKDDPLNAILAGALTGGILAMRGGPSVAIKQALAGGFILAMIEGVSIAFSAIQMRQQQQMMKEMQAQEMAYRARMTQQGGENPWEVNVNKQIEEGQEKLEAKLQDSADSSEGTRQGRTFSF